MTNGPYSVKEMSRMMARSEKTVYRMLESGKLKGYKELDTWRIFLPSNGVVTFASPDTGSTGNARVQDTELPLADRVRPASGQIKTCTGQFIKGLVIGISFILVLIKSSEMLGFIDILWFRR